MEWFEKRQRAIDDPRNPLNPVNNTDHFVMIALENLIVEWNTRGCKEPVHIVKEDFEQGRISPKACMQAFLLFV